MSDRETLQQMLAEAADERNGYSGATLAALSDAVVDAPAEVRQWLVSVLVDVVRANRDMSRALARNLSLGQGDRWVCKRTLSEEERRHSSVNLVEVHRREMLRQLGDTLVDVIGVGHWYAVRFDRREQEMPQWHYGGATEVVTTLTVTPLDGGRVRREAANGE